MSSYFRQPSQILQTRQNKTKGICRRWHNIKGLEAKYVLQTFTFPSIGKIVVNTLGKGKVLWEVSARGPSALNALFRKEYAST